MTAKEKLQALADSLFREAAEQHARAMSLVGVSARLEQAGLFLSETQAQGYLDAYLKERGL